MARPKRQAARREQLVHAACQVMARRGVRGLRIKDVAAESGVSPGLVSYYFPDLAQLIFEVHQHAVERFYWARRRRVEELASPIAALRRLAYDGIPQSPDDVVPRALNALHVYASHNDAHAVLMTQLFDREVSLYAEVLQRGADAGAFQLTQPPRSIGIQAVAIEDAMGLHVVARNAMLDRDSAAAALIDYLSMATSCRLSDDALAS